METDLNLKKVSDKILDLKSGENIRQKYPTQSHHGFVEKKEKNFFVWHYFFRNFYRLLRKANKRKKLNSGNHLKFSGRG